MLNLRLCLSRCTSELLGKTTVAISTKQLLGVETMNVLADKGYHTGDHLARCAAANSVTYVSPKESASNDDDIYPISRFVYNAESDKWSFCATCPDSSGDSRWGQFTE